MRKPPILPPIYFLAPPGVFIIYLLVQLCNNKLSNVDLLTGWLLFFAIFFQSFYQGRKFRKILIGRSAMWLLAHITIGTISLFIFMLHIEWRVPTGFFEITLSLVYLGTVFSGLFGLFLYRTLPKRFLKTYEEITFQRIPQRINLLRKKAEKIAMTSINTSESTVLVDYYSDFISHFFLKPRLILRHIITPMSSSNKILIDIKSTEKLIRRVLNAEEKRGVEALLKLVEEKNNLDYQFTLKYMIKAWVFIHAPLAFSTMILIIFHIVITYAYIN